MIRERYRKIEEVTKYSNYYLGKMYTWLSTPISERAAAWGVHPNVMTLISLLVGVVAAGFFLQGDQVSLLVGAILLYLSYVLDWCDGQVARFTGKVSPFGGWLDQISDRTKEFLIVLSLSYGYARVTGDESVYLWGLGALFLLFLLESYPHMNRLIPVARASHAGSLQDSSASVAKAPVKRMVLDFSIDEQYAVYVLGTLLLGAKWTLMAVVFLAGVIAVYKPLRGWSAYMRAKREGLL